MTSDNTVTVEIAGGPTIDIEWSEGMTVTRALQDACDKVDNDEEFTFGLQYYPRDGHLVMMINENYDSFVSSSDPSFFWELFINGKKSETGVDHTILNNGDVVRFEFEMYDKTNGPSPVAQFKYQRHRRASQPR